MCYMLSTTPVVRTEEIFTDTLGRQGEFTQCAGYDSSVVPYERVVSCLSYDVRNTYTQPGTGQYPNCSDTILTSTTFEDTEHYMLSLTNTTTDYTMISNSFEVDGEVRSLSDMVELQGEQLFGRLHAPYDDNAEVTGATVYYNNQVIMSVWILKCRPLCCCLL